MQNAVPFKGSNQTNTGTGCEKSTFLPNLLECGHSSKLNDGFTRSVALDSVFLNVTSFFAFSRKFRESGVLTFIFSNSIPLGSVHVVLHFFNSPNNSIGLPSITLSTTNLEPVAFALHGNSDLSQADSTTRNVTLILDSSTTPKNFINIVFKFQNNSRIDWFLISEVEFFNSKNNQLFSLFYPNFPFSSFIFLGSIPLIFDSLKFEGGSQSLAGKLCFLVSIMIMNDSCSYSE